MKLLASTSIGQTQMILASNSNICRKLFKIWKINVKDTHTILALFQRSEHTNFSSKQRLVCLLAYVVTVMAASAFFYGQRSATVYLSFLIFHFPFLISHLSFLISHLSFLISHFSFLISHFSFCIFIYLSFFHFHL